MLSAPQSVVQPPLLESHRPATPPPPPHPIKHSRYKIIDKSNPNSSTQISIQWVLCISQNSVNRNMTYNVLPYYILSLKLTAPKCWHSPLQLGAAVLQWVPIQTKVPPPPRGREELLGWVWHEPSTCLRFSCQHTCIEILAQIDNCAVHEIHPLMHQRTNVTFSLIEMILLTANISYFTKSNLLYLIMFGSERVQTPPPRVCYLIWCTWQVYRV